MASSSRIQPCSTASWAVWSKILIFPHKSLRGMMDFPQYSNQSWMRLSYRSNALTEMVVGNLLTWLQRSLMSNLRVSFVLLFSLLCALTYADHSPMNHRVLTD